MKLMFLFLVGICMSNGLYLENDQTQTLLYAADKPTDTVFFGDSVCNIPYEKTKSDTLTAEDNVIDVTTNE